MNFYIFITIFTLHLSYVSSETLYNAPKESVDETFKILAPHLTLENFNNFKKDLATHLSNYHFKPIKVLFVRHALSCANAMQTKNIYFRPKAYYYADPELTAEGILRSKDQANDLLEKIQTIFPEENYILGASTLIRAQETSYLMTQKVQKPISIIPFVA